MECQIHSPSLRILCKIPPNKPASASSSLSSSQLKLKNQITPPPSSSYQQQPPIPIQTPRTEVYNVGFETLGGCKLGISQYPDFEYNAQGGKGTGTGKHAQEEGSGDEISVVFDLNTLHIPPLTSATTRFLGLPLPPFLKIDIVPENLRGSIDPESGKVDLEFKAKFRFSIGNIYKAPPLLVETVLTSEQSEGTVRSGRGDRMDKEGKCRLIGVAKVEPINDLLMDSFLGLPTECLAELNAIIFLHYSS